MIVIGEHQPLLLQQRPHLTDATTVSASTDAAADRVENAKSDMSSCVSDTVRQRPSSWKRSFWKGMMLCGTGMTILATLFALYTATLTVSSISKQDIAVTEQERSLLSHYYGQHILQMISFFDSTQSQSTSTSSVTYQLVQQLRKAQQMADTTIQELNQKRRGDSHQYVLDEPEDGDVNHSGEDTNKASHNTASTGTSTTNPPPPPPPVRGRRQQRQLHPSKSDHPDDPHHHHHSHHQDKKKHNDQNDHVSLPPPAIGCETTVVLIRHCEKELIAEHCAYNGYERSVYISTLFGDADTAKYPQPTLIFAESPVARNTHSSKMNFREVETVGPMSKLLNVPIDDSYTDDTIDELAQHLRDHIKRGTYCGQVIVVVWKHTRIAELANMLGCGPIQGCPLDYSGKTFDQLWQIRYVYTNEYTHSTHKHHFLHHPSENVYWKVFGSVQYENFDPLAFSKLRGTDYSIGSNNNHNNKRAWQEDVVSYPERSYSTDTAGWKVSMLGSSQSTTTTTTSGTSSDSTTNVP